MLKQICFPFLPQELFAVSTSLPTLSEPVESDHTSISRVSPEPKLTSYSRPMD